MKRLKKILFYISTIRGGGAARVMVNLANSFAENGYEIYFVTNFPAEHEYELTEKIKRVNLEEKEDKSNVLKKNVRRIHRLRIIIKSEKPDVCVAFFRESNFRLILATMGISTKRIISVRNDPKQEYKGALNRTLARYLFSMVDGIVFQTEEARLWFPKNIRKKSCVIFNQVDRKFFDVKKGNDDYIVACGRLSEEKNYPMMLKAFAEVLKFHRNERLRIYGEGELKDSLVKLAKSLGIVDSVDFMGFSTEMTEVYRNAKLFLLTSNFEGMPNGLMEAMTVGVPCISTDCPCGGPRMLFGDELKNYLVQINNHENLSILMIELLDNKDECDRIGKLAKEKAKMFNPDVVFSDWERFIVSLTKTSRQ